MEQKLNIYLAWALGIVAILAMATDRAVASGARQPDQEVIAWGKREASR